MKRLSLTWADLERLLAPVSFGLGPVARYISAMALVAGALAVRMMIAPPNAGLPFITFFPAAALSAIVGGLGPGLLAAGLCTALSAWLFIDFANPSAVLTILIFVLDAVVVCTAIEAMRRYYHRTQAVTGDLERTIGRLSAMNTELERFAYVASHDLQEPLRSIISFSQLVARDYGDRLDERGRECLGFVIGGGKRLHGLITDLSTYSHVTLGAGRRQTINSRAALQHALDTLAEAPQQSGASVTIGPLPEIWGNQAQLGQVFLHLLDNAIKFRAPGRPLIIAIAAERHENEWVFGVTDNGIGFDGSEQDIFEIFRQLHPRGRYGGQGLGLAICRRIIHDHGGRIWAESAVGRGSSFHFSIPIGAPEAVLAANGPPHPRQDARPEGPDPATGAPSHVAQLPPSPVPRPAL